MQEVTKLVDTQNILLVCYGINTVVLGTLAVYFYREYYVKRLRASLAWALGFTFFAFTVANLAVLTTEITRSQVALGGLIAAVMLSFFYYGASLLFFSEKSFFREKMTTILFLVVLGMSEFLAITFPLERLASIRLFIMLPYWVIFSGISYLFYRVRGRLSKEDPRRRPITLTAVAWFIVAIWMFYIEFLWGWNRIIEAVVFLLGSFGFGLLLIGMTWGRGTRA